MSRRATVSALRQKHRFTYSSQRHYVEGRSKWRTAGLIPDSHLPEPPFRTIRIRRGRDVKEDYEFHHGLGSGAFGTVTAATCRETGEVVAIKSVPKKMSGSRKLSKTPGTSSMGYHQEFELLRCVNEQQIAQPSPHNCKNWQEQNSHVMQVHCAYDEDPEELESGNFHLVMEHLAGGELYDFLAGLYGSREGEEEVVSEALAVSFAQQMLQAVEACHFTGFAHLDIKPENFIFEKSLPNGEADPTSRLVLCDFGCAEAFDTAPYAAYGTEYEVGLDDVVDMDLHRAAGTLRYVSPEVIDGYFSSRSDTWSIGAVLFLMLHGKTPYSTNTLAHRSAMPPSVPGGGVQCEWEVPVSKELEELVMCLLSPNPMNRFSATEALDFIDTKLVHRVEDVPVPELKGFPARLKSRDPSREDKRVGQLIDMESIYPP